MKPHSPDNHHDRQVLSRRQREVTRVDNRAVGGAQEIEEETHRAIPDQKDHEVRPRLRFASSEPEEQEEQHQAVDRVVQAVIVTHAVWVLHAQNKVGECAGMVVDEETTDAADKNSKREAEYGCVRIGVDVDVRTT